MKDEITLTHFQAECKEGMVTLQWEIETIAPFTAFHVYRSVTKDGPYQFLGKTEKNEFIDAEPKE